MFEITNQSMNYWTCVPFWTLRLLHFHHSSGRFLLLVKFQRKMAPNPYIPYIYIYMYISLYMYMYNIYIYTHYIHCCWYPIISHDINQTPKFLESPRLDSPAQNIASHGSRSHRNLSLSSTCKPWKKAEHGPMEVATHIFGESYINIYTYMYVYIDRYIYIYIYIYLLLYYIYYIIYIYIYYYIIL